MTVYEDGQHVSTYPHQTKVNQNILDTSTRCSSPLLVTSFGALAGSDWLWIMKKFQYFETWARHLHVLVCKWLTLSKSFEIDPVNYCVKRLQLKLLGQLWLSKPRQINLLVFATVRLRFKCEVWREVFPSVWQCYGNDSFGDSSKSFR